MTTKAGRNKTITTHCAHCGTPFEAIESRVKIGQGLFCSRTCANLYRTKGSEKKYVGKENACVYWNKNSNRYDVYWFEVGTLKRKSSTYAKWCWEMNFGEVPDGYSVGYADGDTTNISVENLTLLDKEGIGKIISNRLMGHKHSDETKRKLSKKHFGKTLSEDHKHKIGLSSAKSWADGIFDKVHFGEYNKHWRGGVEQRYPNEFSEDIKRFIWQRDGFRCCVCGKDLLGKRGEIHHIDRDRKNNDFDNLMLLCSSCHQGGVHSQQPTDNEDILALRRMMK